MNHHFNAIIFDLDGTLADTIVDLADATNRSLSRLGFPQHNYEEYKFFVGKGIKNLVTQALPENKRAPECISICLEYMTEEYSHNYMDKTRLYPDIPELLNALVKRNIKMSVLSNKADLFTQKLCGKLLKDWHFEIIMGANDRFPIKPNPEAAIFIGKQMNTNPDNILYLGDTNIDMITANGAGFFPVGVTWGFRTEEELLENGAKYIIHNPMELLKLLD